MPAAGGWGGSNRTLGITVEGFTEEEVCFGFSACMRGHTTIVFCGRSGEQALSDAKKVAGGLHEEQYAAEKSA
jgi:hypothetical protein